ncbi:hypothetical protein [Hymenobacter sp. BT730]|uniref:hypothetical protein n=1 Tax=Hymenobacter sp. BT730 TaxID=3063332 RepID=UPI0026E06A2F|nr:hypothetical protein [Hymenobacter sp. BT730]
MHCLYKEIFESGLGALELRVNSNSAFVVVETGAFSTVLLTVGHRVTILRTPVSEAHLPTSRSISYAKAWLFYIQKRNSVPEQLTFSMRIAELGSNVETSPNTGEWLTAIEFANDFHQLHIGTEDEDSYAWEAGSAWIPKRLGKALKEGLIITTIEEDGLTTQIPELMATEQFYFHYIVAESPRRKSLDYPNEWDIATWEAVRQQRKVLEESWRQQTKEPPL